MYIDQIKYIVKVADTNSISTAAKELHVSQPNVSQSIVSLEKELNIEIFNRTRLGTYPTKPGKAIIEKARIILDNLNELYDVAQLEFNILKGSLRVVTIPIIGSTFLPKTLGVFKSNFPEVQIEVFEEGSKQGIKCVLDEEFDVAIISQQTNAPEDSRISFEPLLYSRTVAYVGKQSPLARKKEISLKEIVEHPIVLFNELYSSHYYLRASLEKYGKPYILFTSGNSETIKKVISENLAIGFYSDIVSKIDPYILSNQIVPIPIKEEKEVNSTYGFITKKKSIENIIVQKFIGELKLQAELFKNLNELHYSDPYEIKDTED